MGNSQFNVAYIPQEDRILLQMHSPDNELFRFLLTRRLTKQLISAFDTILNQEAEIKQSTTAVPATPEVKQAMKEFQHAGALEKADFASPFAAEDAKSPLGKNPILIHTMQVSVLSNNTVNMRLVIAQDKSLDVNLNMESLHALYHIFSQTVTSAEWDLSVNQFGESEQDKKRLQ